MKVFVVVRTERGCLSYREDECGSENTYKSKPIAIFFARKDAFEYVRDHNSQFFNEEDDGPSESIWAIENGYF